VAVACRAAVHDSFQSFQRESERRPVEFLALERKFLSCSNASRRGRAREVGSLSLVDDAHTQAQIEFDLESIGADV
jgi:hypothetical protein